MSTKPRYNCGACGDVHEYGKPCDPTTQDTTSIDEQIMDILRHPHTKLPKDHIKTWRAINNEERQEQLVMLKALISDQVAKELANLKIAKLNLDKLTTDHADGYQMAVEDMNLNIDNRIATLNGVKNR